MSIENMDYLAHIADSYNRYPGEKVNFHTCFAVQKVQQGMVLSVLLPNGIQLVDYCSNDEHAVAAVAVRDNENGTLVTWTLADEIISGEKYEFVTSGSIQKITDDIFLSSKAILSDYQGYEIASESVGIKLKTQGEYIKHLPELYRKDEMMGRFLMLFESFWKPIEQQIKQISNYFDPDLTPEDMLPWLASWVGAYWDELLPENRKRKLIRIAASHYQRRGTKSVLEEFLTLYTAGDVEISEHPAHNLVLGEKARLGPKVALGLQNHPHTFTVDVKVCKDDFDFPETIDQVLLEKVVRQKLNKIIDLHKPAHTAHNLNLEFRDQ